MQVEVKNLSTNNTKLKRDMATLNLKVKSLEIANTQAKEITSFNTIK